MRFAASRSKPAPIYARGNTKWRQWSSHSNAIYNQRFKNCIELRTQEQPLVAKHIGGTDWTRNDPNRTRRTDEVPFIAGWSHFTRKNTRFRAPASSPKHSPCNIHAAMTMRFAASRTKPAPIYARGNIKWRQWSSHSNAICNQRFKNRIELCTQEQPLVAKHIGGTDWTRNDPNRTRRTDGVPFFHRRLKPLYTEKHKVLCSGFLPETKPMQHSCSHYNVFYSMTWLTRMHLRTWQHQMTTIMQPFQCDLQLQIQETHRTTHTGTTTGCRTQRRNRLNSKRSKPHPPHTRGTFHRRLKPLYTEKHKVSCSGFLPKK